MIGNKFWPSSSSHEQYSVTVCIVKPGRHHHQHAVHAVLVLAPVHLLSPSPSGIIVIGALLLELVNPWRRVHWVMPLTAALQARLAKKGLIKGPSARESPFGSVFPSYTTFCSTVVWYIVLDLASCCHNNYISMILPMQLQQSLLMRLRTSSRPNPYAPIKTICTINAHNTVWTNTALRFVSQCVCMCFMWLSLPSWALQEWTSSYLPTGRK